MLSGRGPRIGVTVEDLTPEEAAKVSGARGGVRITRIDPDSPAAQAGLREGDVVVEFEGETVRSTRQFARLVQETPSGHRVTLGIVRDGVRRTIEVTPEAAPALAWGVDADLIGERIERQLREIEPRLRELEPRLREFRFDVPEDFHFDFDVDVFPWAASPRARLGVQLDELTPQLAEYFGARDGVLVTSVTPGTPAEAAGLRAGDVITSIDGAAVRDREDVVDELRDKEGAVTIGIVRDRKEMSVKATLEPRQPRRFTARRPA
jgi:serine protease Do